jgi:1-acyl-sn-glycerol-3-phosphate acyltransferase
MFWRFLWIFVSPPLRMIMRYRRKVFAYPSVGDVSAPPPPHERKKIPLLVISNHNTDLDPFFAGTSFPNHLYYVASEHTFRMGFASKLIRFFFDPIPITKGVFDTAALRDVFGRLQAGYNVHINAEGNRSFSGLTGEIPESTGKLARLAARTAGAALVTYRIRGGYFASPRWADKMRKGEIWGEPVACYPPEKLLAMTAGEIAAHIREDTFEDAYETQRRSRYAYRGRGLAEHLETALYLCPCCGRIATLVSRGDRLSCGCGFYCRYDEFGILHPAVPEGLVPLREPFSTVRDWWLWQYDAMASRADIALSDEDEIIYEIDVHSASRRLGKGTLSLDGEGLRCGAFFFPLETIPALAIYGQRTMSFSARGKRYELRNRKPRSAAKYQRVFDLLKKRCKGE